MSALVLTPVNEHGTSMIPPELPMQLVLLRHRVFPLNLFGSSNHINPFVRHSGVKPIRCNATSPSSLAIEPSSIYVSTSTSPLWNLSLEELLFRNTPTEPPLLLIYRNEPCVVIGRNQNPWKEINQAALKASGIPFIRRRSGGGTVYHDLGNTNFSLHLPRASFERKKGTQLALQALKRLKVPDAWVNERNDVCVGEYKISIPSLFTFISCGYITDKEQYVSGSAYKIINSRAYHHGTMLLDAQIGQLRGVLHNTKDSMVGRSVASVRSPVRNISELVDFPITHEAFVAALAEAFASTYGVEGKVVKLGEEIMDGPCLFEKEFISKSIKELQSWEWQYGQTLEFEHPMSGKINGNEVLVVITAKHGIITNCNITYQASEEAQQRAGDMSKKLVGMRYGLLDVKDFTEEDNALIEWLQHEM